MNYTIKSSRLDEVIMNYLDSAFSGIEKQDDEVGTKIYPRWEKNGETIIQTSKSLTGQLAVGVEHFFYYGFMRLFNLVEDEADEYFKVWVEKNLGLEPFLIYDFY